ncbi:MAG: hypothetical protein IKP07_01595 [Bacilli bacterium]|nr:hypothetical protein [Bacilli bacterium]
MKKSKKKRVKTIKCNKCGYMNPFGLEKCTKCGAELKVNKVCPNCAKINAPDAEHCVNCGHIFGRGSRSFLVNFFLSVLLVSSLLIINYYDPTVFKSLTNNMKRVAVIVIILILVATLTYGKKDITKYSAEEKILENNKVIRLRKYTSIALGVILAGIFIFVCFKYLIK